MAKDEKQDNQDVKSNSEAPSAKETSEQDVIGDLEEKDIESFAADKQIPYARFKEVNEKAKTASQELDQLKSSFDRKLERAVEEAEQRALAKVQRERESQELDTLDPTDQLARSFEKKISELENRLSNVSESLSVSHLKDKIRSLEAQYPEADTDAVLGWVKSTGGDLEDLMERSHRKNVEYVKTKFQQMVSDKKKRAKAAVPSSFVGAKLKDEEKPKTLKDAKKLFMKYAGG